MMARLNASRLLAGIPVPALVAFFIDGVSPPHTVDEDSHVFIAKPLFFTLCSLLSYLDIVASI